MLHKFMHSTIPKYLKSSIVMSVQYLLDVFTYCTIIQYMQDESIGGAYLNGSFNVMLSS